MDVAQWCTASRVWVVAGKGGVGKSTVAATLATMAATAGLSVMLVELEGKRSLPAAFGHDGPLGYEAVVLSGPGQADRIGAGGNDPPPDDVTGPLAPGTVAGRCITPDDALLEYLGDHGLQRISRRLVSSGVLDVVATAIPGMRDVLVLGKVKQIERSGVADLVVLDAPATGHAMTFLSSAGGLLDASRSGPIRTQAADVVELLRDPARTRVLLVTLPEEMPVSETVEAAFFLEDRVGVQLGPVVVNCYEELARPLAPDAAAAARQAGVALPRGAAQALDEAAAFRTSRQSLVDGQVDRLARELPLPQLRLPRLPDARIGPSELSVLAEAMTAGIGALRTPVGTP